MGYDKRVYGSVWKKSGTSSSKKTKTYSKPDVEVKHSAKSPRPKKKN